ncbi:MAG: DUF2252 family protein [Myxococcota bacterium]
MASMKAPILRITGIGLAASVNFGILLTNGLACAASPTILEAKAPPRRQSSRAVSAVQGSGGLRLAPRVLPLIAQHPRLVEELRDSLYAFFRFQHEAFTARSCSLFERDRFVLPLVNLHGDAHLVQYASTQLGFGLDDFDEAGFGPAVVDLVRFGASIHIACQEVDFPCDAASAVEVFLAAYRRAVLAPRTPLAVPTWVRRARRRPDSNREAHLAFAESLMAPVDPPTRRHLDEAWAEMTTMLRNTGFRASQDYLDIVRVGRIDLGVGSALTQKYLLRVRGPSSDPSDDRIIEVKAHSGEDRTSCVFHPPTGGVLYPQVMQRRLGRVSPEILAYLASSGTTSNEEEQQAQTYWVRSWDPDYKELGLDELADQAELEEVAADAGLQLGRGHCSHVTAPLEAQHRFAHDRSLTGLAPRLEAAMELLALEVRSAWEADRLFLDSALTTRMSSH